MGSGGEGTGCRVYGRLMCPPGVIAGGGSMTGLAGEVVVVFCRWGRWGLVEMG